MEVRYPWASCPSATDIQFVEAETPDEEALLDSVWSASANEPLSDGSIAVALRLASA